MITALLFIISKALKVLFFVLKIVLKIVWHCGLYFPIIHLIYGIILSNIFGFELFGDTLYSKLFVWGLVLSFTDMAIIIIRKFFIKPAVKTKQLFDKRIDKSTETPVYDNKMQHKHRFRDNKHRYDDNYDNVNISNYDDNFTYDYTDNYPSSDYRNSHIDYPSGDYKNDNNYHKHYRNSDYKNDNNYYRHTPKGYQDNYDNVGEHYRENKPPTSEQPLVYQSKKLPDIIVYEYRDYFDLYKEYDHKLVKVKTIKK